MYFCAIGFCILCPRSLPNSKRFYRQDQTKVVFFHGKSSILQNYGLLFTALKGVLQWCSTKVGVPQKAVLKYNSSALLIKTFEKQL